MMDFIYSILALVLVVGGGAGLIVGLYLLGGGDKNVPAGEGELQARGCIGFAVVGVPVLAYWGFVFYFLEKRLPDLARDEPTIVQKLMYIVSVVAAVVFFFVAKLWLQKSKWWRLMDEWARKVKPPDPKRQEIVARRRVRKWEERRRRKRKRELKGKNGPH